jgi:hypothetical protein
MRLSLPTRVRRPLRTTRARLALTVLYVVVGCGVIGGAIQALGV